MITLNTDQGLVRFESWEEVETRPGFSPRLDPRQRTLKSIVGYYGLPTWRPCGLSICQTPHGIGYMVQTTDGSVTNIGKDCGKRYFGVEFKVKAKQFERDLRGFERRERVRSAQLQGPAIQARLDALKDEPRGGQWITRTLRALRDPTQGLPRSTLAQLDGLARRRDGTLTVARVATAQEAEMLKAQGRQHTGGPIYIDDVVGHLEGLAALYPENDLRQLLVIAFADHLPRLVAADPDSLNDKHLRDLAKWTESIEPNLERAAAAIEHGRRLLTPENLGQLTKLANTHEDRKRVSACLSRVFGAGGS